jgi:hypothetical protein
MSQLKNFNFFALTLKNHKSIFFFVTSLILMPLTYDLFLLILIFFFCITLVPVHENFNKFYSALILLWFITVLCCFFLCHN